MISYFGGFGLRRQALAALRADGFALLRFALLHMVWVQDKIKSQRQEAAAQRPNNADASDYEDGALGRRTDSLEAALGLLEDKLNLINSAGSAPRVDMNRIRADVEREMSAKLEGDMAARLRTLGDAIRLESRETIRRKDAEIEGLQAHVAELREQLDQQHHQNGNAQLMHEQQLVERLRVRDAEVESLEQIKAKMMADRAVLEQIIRNERKQREEEFNGTASMLAPCTTQPRS